MKTRRKFIQSASLLVTSAGVFGYYAAHSKNFEKEIKIKKETMMQHNVYFWLKEEVTESEKESFIKGTKDYVNAVKEVKKAEIGIPAGTADRDVVDHSFGVSLLVSFTSLENHNIYQEHPAHKKFIEDFSHLWARVQVYDSQIL